MTLGALLLACVLPAAGEPPSPERLGDLWPHTVSFPDASRIKLSRRGDGTTTVSGLPGVVSGRLPVLVLCPNTGAAALVESGDDGSFEARLAAPPGSWVVVKYDPTGSQRLWLHRPFEQIGSDVSMAYANAAPGVWLRVPASPAPPGAGTPFDASGTTLPGGADFHISGRQAGRLAPGGAVVIEGIVTLRVSSSAAPAWVGRRLEADADLTLHFDRDGRARAETGFYFSNILTPTGLPVQTRGQARFRWPGLRSGPLVADRAGGLRAPVRWTLPLPGKLPPGVYGVRMRVRADGAQAAPGGLRSSRQVTLTRDLAALPLFSVGAPQPPRLTWTLLTDVPGADGSRGAVAEEDREDFELGGARRHAIAALRHPAGRLPVGPRFDLPSRTVSTHGRSRRPARAQSARHRLPLSVGRLERPSPSARRRRRYVGAGAFHGRAQPRAGHVFRASSEQRRRRSRRCIPIDHRFARVRLRFSALRAL